MRSTYINHYIHKMNHKKNINKLNEKSEFSVLIDTKEHTTNVLSSPNKEKEKRSFFYKNSLMLENLHKRNKIQEVTKDTNNLIKIHSQFRRTNLTLASRKVRLQKYGSLTAYHLPLLHKFITHLMKKGKKHLSEKVFYELIKSMRSKLLTFKRKTSPLIKLNAAFLNIKPQVGLEPFIKSGRTILYPKALHIFRQSFAALKFFMPLSSNKGSLHAINPITLKKEKNFMIEMRNGILSASEKKGIFFKNFTHYNRNVENYSAFTRPTSFHGQKLKLSYFHYSRINFFRHVLLKNLKSKDSNEFFAIVRSKFINLKNLLKVKENLLENINRDIMENFKKDPIKKLKKNTIKKLRKEMIQNFKDLKAIKITNKLIKYFLPVRRHIKKIIAKTIKVKSEKLLKPLFPIKLEEDPKYIITSTFIENLIYGMVINSLNKRLKAPLCKISLRKELLNPTSHLFNPQDKKTKPTKELRRSE